MKRKTFLVTLLAPIVALAQRKGEGEKPNDRSGSIVFKTPTRREIDTRPKWYVTGFGHDCEMAPLVAHGRDRLEALVSCGLTVWSEQEWAERNARDKGEFRKACDAMGLKLLDH